MSEEISDIIQILHPNKASGPDVISHKMLKLCPNKIALPLQIIFNKFLQQSKYPTNWKLAHVIAVFKKGNSSLQTYITYKLCWENNGESCIQTCLQLSPPK